MQITERQLELVNEKKRIYGPERAIIMRRAVDLVNEGWALDEVAELLKSEGLVKAGKPITANYVYSLLYNYVNRRGGTVRPGIRFTNSSSRVCKGLVKQQKKVWKNIYAAAVGVAIVAALILRRFL